MISKIQEMTMQYTKWEKSYFSHTEKIFQKLQIIKQKKLIPPMHGGGAWCDVDR